MEEILKKKQESCLKTRKDVQWAVSCQNLSVASIASFKCWTDKFLSVQWEKMLKN